MLTGWIIRCVVVSLAAAIALPRLHTYIQTTIQQPFQELEAAERQIHTALGELQTSGPSTVMDDWPRLSSSQAPLPLIHVAPAISARLLASSSTFTTR